MIEQLYEPFQRWAEQGAVWVYSDPHFSDIELKQGIASRPSDEELVAKINNKVGKKDTLIILGDVGNVEYIKKLRGYKVLIAGNHDKGMSNYKRQIIHKIFSDSEYSASEAKAEMQKRYPSWKISVEGQGYGFHAPFSWWEVSADNQLFDEVYSGPLMIAERLILSHEPIEKIDWAFNIHGHVHIADYHGDQFHLNCCAEAIYYTPISLNAFMKQGYLAKIKSIHRDTIDKAAEKKMKRKGKNK